MENLINMEKVVKIIKDEIEARGLKVVKIILFGSRAKGNPKEDSDWDFFVVVNKNINFKQKREILTSIYRKTVEQGIVGVDIVITSLEKFKETKKYAGTLSYEVDNEGIIMLENKYLWE
jgi:predicted nucleotidyltransferase